MDIQELVHNRHLNESVSQSFGCKRVDTGFVHIHHSNIKMKMKLARRSHDSLLDYSHNFHLHREIIPGCSSSLSNGTPVVKVRYEIHIFQKWYRSISHTLSIWTSNKGTE